MRLRLPGPISSGFVTGLLLHVRWCVGGRVSGCLGFMYAHCIVIVGNHVGLVAAMPWSNGDEATGGQELCGDGVLRA